MANRVFTIFSTLVVKGLKNSQPMDAPWSLFDLAHAELLLPEDARFGELLDSVDDFDLADWQIETFLSTLSLLQLANPPGLAAGITRLRASLESSSPCR